MDTSANGLNVKFPIYKADGTSFEDLVLHKSAFESVVMSLGDKITGDVYYKNNRPACCGNTVPSKSIGTVNTLNIFWIEIKN